MPGPLSALSKSSTMIKVAWSVASKGCCLCATDLICLYRLSDAMALSILPLFFRPLYARFMTFGQGRWCEKHHETAHGIQDQSGIRDILRVDQCHSLAGQDFLTLWY